MEPFTNSTSKGWTRIFAAALILLSWPAGATQDRTDSDEARLLRFPHIHGDFVVFVYGGDLWRAPSLGGEARQLTSHPGQELFPKISPDGRLIAFSAEYSGSRQVYVMPAEGGQAKQLTFYNDVGDMPPRGGFDYWVLGWAPDGKILVRMNRAPWDQRIGRPFLVDPAGGLETPLPLPHTGGASFSADGKQLAYCPIDREFRTWKRTRGGRAQDIWLYDLETNRSQQLTEDPGTDNFPMWVDETIYFTSDRDGTLNLFAYDLPSKKLRKVTDFDTWDVLWPSLGDDQIVFMKGGYLYRFDLGSEQSTRIPISIHADLPYAAPRFEDVADNLHSGDLSPSGARAVLSARGELFTVPAEHGAVRHLSKTPNAREIFPAWSPDGRSIAYLSDATGEYEIYIRPQDGSGEPRQLTDDGHVWRFEPRFSPDSKKLAFGDRNRRLWLLDIASGEKTEVDQGAEGDLTVHAWSPNSQYLVYQKILPSGLPGLMLFDTARDDHLTLSDGLSPDHDPVFSHDGQYLLFLSERDYPIRFSAFEFNYLYNRATRIYMTPLNPQTPHPFPPRSDEEEGSSGNDSEGVEVPSKAKGKGDKDQDNTDSKALQSDRPIVADGFVARTLALPNLPPADYAELATSDGFVFYLRADAEGQAAVYRYDLAKRQEETILARAESFVLSRDGKKILYTADSALGIANVEPNLDPQAGKLDLSTLRIKLDPRNEWRQMFVDAWRIGRDWFYDPAMHGVDWTALRQRYGELVPHIAHRSELDFILGEMIGELQAGHTYVQAGEEPKVKRVEGGLLGCDLELDDASGFYRVGRIFAGENWDETYRSPLTEPGVAVREGQFLLAIDGQTLRHPDNPYRLLEGKAGQIVELLVGDQPSLTGAYRVRARTVSSEQDLRYLDWVKSRMALTERLSDDRIGYIHLPNTAIAGNRMLQKLFYSQSSKEALIIDDRYNGGGFIPDRMIETLSRTTLSYWARRDIASLRTPGFAHDGPKVMLINGFSASGGDALPYYFRQLGLGKLIGTRTWGGLIGLTGGPELADGGSVLVPTFRIYDRNRQWVVENQGVAPDIEVFDLPEALLTGGDPSLEKAVEVLLEELARQPVTRPEAPVPPDMVP